MKPEVAANGLALFSQENGLGTLTLNRPESGNAIDPSLIADLALAIRKAETSGCRALLLTAAGANFCVGADLKYFADRPDRLPAELAEMVNGFHAALARLCELPIPVVAAVRGNAVGAGFGLALAADVVVAADDARFATGYARLGLSADAGVSYFLTRALGPRLARSLLITARPIAATEALERGLVDQIVGGGDLAGRAEAFARELANGPTAAFATIKALTREAWNSPDLGAHLDRERDAIVALAGDERVIASIRTLLLH